jgi:hypothetical protein
VAGRRDEPAARRDAQRDRVVRRRRSPRTAPARASSTPCDQIRAEHAGRIAANSAVEAADISVR